MNKKRWCCFEKCTNDVEFSILAHRQNGSSAGPDFYSDTTEACEAHVGALLGWQPNAENTDEICWTVYQEGGTP